jgi:PKHD-type hydroxylase
MKLTTEPHFVRSIVQPYTIWNNCFTDEQLDLIVNAHDELGVSQSYVGPDSSLNHSIRKSANAFHYKTDQNSWIFDRLLYMVELTNDIFFQFDLIGFEKYQYTVYNNTDYYDYHVDTVYGATLIDKESHLTRKLSMTILLNDPSEFEGGNFELCYGKPDEAISLKLEKGTAIFFPSYMMHRVTPITKGTRKSLVVWTVGPKFK